MHTKTLIAVLTILGVILLPLGTWTLYTTASSSTRISVLEESKGDIKERLKSMDKKLDLVLDEQAKVREELRLFQKGSSNGLPGPLRRGDS